MQRLSRLAGVAIILFVLFAAGRTLIYGSAPTTRANSDFTSEYLSAVEAAKEAYLYHTVASTVTSTKRPNSSLGTKYEDRVIATWHRLASMGSKTAVRREGLLMLALDRPEGLKRLTAQSSPATVPMAHKVNRGPTTVQDEIDRASRANEPSAIQEQQLWQLLYSRQAVSLTAAQYLTVRDQIDRLNLGWFKHIPLRRAALLAGDQIRANEELTLSRSSAARAASGSNWQLSMAGTGILLWILTGLIWIGRKLLAVSNPRLATLRSWSAAGPLVAEQTDLPEFSYRARAFAFATYLGANLFIRYPLRLILPNASHWKPESRVIANASIQMVLSTLLCVASIMVMRKLHKSEGNGGAVPSFWSTLSIVGMRSNQPISELFNGFLGYMLTLPCMLLAGYISQYLLFRHSHTPINPVEIEGVMAATFLGHFLVFLETSIFAPLIEETMFRGILFPALKQQWGTTGGMVLTSAVFALLHPNLPAGFLPLFALGFGLNYVANRRQSLLPSITMHAIHNAGITLSMFMIMSS